MSTNKPVVKKVDESSGMCSKPGAPPVKTTTGLLTTERSIGDFHATLHFDKVITAVPVTLPKIELKPLKLRRPKLQRKPMYDRVFGAYFHKTHIKIGIPNRKTLPL